MTTIGSRRFRKLDSVLPGIWQEEDGTTKIEGLEENIRTGLVKKHYTPHQRLGEGNTRDVYLSVFSPDPGVNRLRVVKVAKEQIVGTSVTSQRNTDSVNVDERELRISNKIRHPNVIPVVGHFEIDGRTVNVEEYRTGVRDLESIIESYGDETMPVERAERIFSNMVRVMHDVVYTDGVLHRDLKPSNILVDEKDNVYIDDWQNAEEKDNVFSKVMCTKGATPYTEVDILNGYVSGRPVSATESNDMYALATIFAEMLTGKRPNYSLQNDEEGNLVEVDGRQYRMSLTVDGDKVSGISAPSHDKMWKGIIGKVPTRYQAMLNNAIRGVHKEKGWLKKKQKPIGSIDDLLRAFEGAKERTTRDKIREKLQEDIPRAAKTGLVAGLIAAGIAGGTIIGIRMESGELPDYSLATSVRANAQNRFAMEDLGYEEWFARAITLDDVMRDAVSKVKQFDEEDVDFEEYYGRSNKEKFVNGMSMHANNVHGVSYRISRSLIRTNLLFGDSMIDEYPGVDARLPHSYVPEDFYVALSGTIGSRADPLNVSIPSQNAFASMYLRSLIQDEKDIAQVFAEFYGGPELVRQAMITAGTDDYFPDHPKNTDELNYVSAGYRTQLPDHVRQLTDTALALYMVTNEEGDIDMDRYHNLASRREQVTGLSRGYAGHHKPKMAHIHAYVDGIEAQLSERNNE